MAESIQLGLGFAVEKVNFIVRIPQHNHATIFDIATPRVADHGVSAPSAVVLWIAALASSQDHKGVSEVSDFHPVERAYALLS